MTTLPAILAALIFAAVLAALAWVKVEDWRFRDEARRARWAERGSKRRGRL